MTDELRRYYEQELIFIRQIGKEFADQYPKIAGRLLLEEDKCDDPHVERLIEAFALLAGRVRHKIDQEFPEITEAMLGILYPHYLRPVPSMAVAQLEVDPEQAKLSSGYTVDRNTLVYSRPVAGAACRFRTCYPVTLWPLEITAASAGSPAVFSPGPLAEDAWAAIRVEMRCLGGAALNKMGMERLRVFFGESPIAATLYELLLNNAWRVMVRGLPRSARSPRVVLPGASLRAVGFDRSEGMLPYPDRSFLGYRLLQEYFSYPKKFFFFDLCGLDQAAQAGVGEHFEILVLLSEFERKDRLAQLEQGVKAETFRLGCTPIINLFEQIAEPIRLSHAHTEYRVVPDVHRPAATEVYSIDRVTATAPYLEQPQEYEPFYSFRHAYHGQAGGQFWYSTRRPSLRKEDPGTEVYLSFVDLGFRPALPAVETVTVYVSCTNRDLAGKLPVTGEIGELELEAAALVRARCLGRPTEPLRPQLGRGLQWRLISHLSLNHLSIVEGGREALQEVLQLYDFTENPVIRRQIAGITDVRSSGAVARVESEAGFAFCRGIRVEMEFDEEQFAGSEVFLLAAVLERFLGLYSAINSFSQLSVTTKQRKGALRTWAPRAGDQILL